MFGLYYGAAAAGFLVAAAFFLRFWGRTRAPLMAIFSAAFTLLAVSYALLGASDLSEEQSWIYMLRLAAFLLIIVGIVWTNLRGPR